MDIHKPKPVRNWREFVKEYAIIVLGVATALAAEQAVEWLHWQSEVKDARNAIVAEIADNNTRIFARRVAFEPCIQRQLQEADRILTDLEAGRSPGSFTTFHTGSGSFLSDSEWQSERASQVLTHFPRAELALLGRYYAQLQLIDPLKVQEGDAWQELSVLQNPPKGIGVSDLLRLRVALGTVDRVERLIVLDALRQLNVSRMLNIAYQPADPQLVEKFCSLGDLEYLDFIRSRESRQ